MPGFVPGNHANTAAPDLDGTEEKDNKTWMAGTGPGQTGGGGGARGARRDAWLRRHRYRVLRVGNREVMSNIEDVYGTILAAGQSSEGEGDPLPKPASPVSTSPQGGGQAPRRRRGCEDMRRRRHPEVRGRSPSLEGRTMAPRRRRRRTEPPRCALPPHPVCPGPASPVSTSPQGGSQAPRRRYPLPPFRAMIAVVPSAVPVTPAAVAALALAVLGVAAPALAAPADDIRARLEEWTDAFNAKDRDAVCDLFSRDALSTYRGQPERRYDEICELLRTSLDDPARGYHYGLDIREIIVEGDLAVVRLTWTLFITPLNVTSVEPGMDVFRKEADGTWRIVRYLAFEE